MITTRVARPCAIALAALLVGALLAPSGPSAAAAGVVRYAGTPQAVPDSYVVVFPIDTTASETVRRAGELIAKYGGAIRFTYTAALRGFAVSANATQAQLMAGDPLVDYVAQDQAVSLAGLEVQLNPPAWGLDRIDQRSLPLDSKYHYPNTAGSVRAYVIDTGMRLTHQEFGGRAFCGFDPWAAGCAPCNQGHATHVAGTIGGATVGVAKGLRIVSVRVFECSGSTTFAIVIAGVDYVTLAQQTNPNVRSVANMSLGGQAFQPLDDAVTNSIAANVHYSIAAGGSGTSACNFSPARVPRATTVSTTDITDSRAPFANIGPCVDVFAPGVHTYSAWHTADNAYQVLSGTSTSAPLAAGTAALWRQRFPADNADAVHDALNANATPGVVINPGLGSPNRLLYMGMIPA
ncbi:MAG TPA: S8 family serine peptidase [Micromonosporaceae bacterium]|nr:S8 family serine peptidase [Micromonosporaceae bacterium]